MGCSSATAGTFYRYTEWLSFSELRFASSSCSFSSVCFYSNLGLLLRLTAAVPASRVASAASKHAMLMPIWPVALARWAVACC